MPEDLSSTVEFIRPTNNSSEHNGTMSEIAPELAFDEPRRVGSLIRAGNMRRAGTISKEVFAAALSADTAALEVIIDENNILPAWFLDVAPMRSTAVCKIEASGTNYKGKKGAWAGTGFLISDSILLTNHHVINSIDTARNAECIFNYQRDPEGQDLPVKRFRLKPDRLFLTSPTPNGLDFTFIWIEGTPGKQFGTVPFNRDFFVVKERDVANIIQHPGGDYKGVTLQENRVTDVDESLVHYISDTKPGSSGSCVFNNSWMPFALHHASADNPHRDAQNPSQYVNEGIRFSAIVAYLEKQLLDQPQNRNAIQEILSNVNGTDAILGHWGALGRSVPDSGSAVETLVNIYKGEAGDIDVGFWNIEFFNLHHAEKMQRVAEVIVKMNLDIWAFEETSPEATRALTDHLNNVYHLEFGCDFSEPNATSDKQTTAVIWNTKTVDGSKIEWPTEIDEWFHVHSENFDDLNLEAVEGKVFDRYPALFRFANKSGEDFEFFLVPLHLKAKDEGQKRRRMAAAILAAAVDRMINKYGADRDWVIGGDFNAPLASEDFSKLISGGMVPLSAGDEEGGAFSYIKGPLSLIDHVFLSPTLAQTFAADDFFIVAHDKEIPDYVTALSDHRPVLVRLSIQSNQPIHERIAMREQTTMPPALRDKLTSAGIDTTGNGDRREAGNSDVSVPLNVTVTSDGINISARISAGQLKSLMNQPSAGVIEEAVSIDPDYSNRKGYLPNFLGSGAVNVPLPTLSPEMKAKAAINLKANGGDKNVLPYHHYSVVMNAERRLAFYTAVNIDGNIFYNIKREPDKWFFDPRLSKDLQTGNDVYANNPLDRGHLVRRLDPAWGNSKALAKIANDDTFHFTNCTPQHHDFNAGQSLWAGLEDYILKNADAQDFKVSVFTGPIFSDSDKPYRGVKLPRQYWKVVAMVRENGKLSATAYLLSQESLLQTVGEEAMIPEDFSFGAYKTFQVPVKRIEKLTGLNFGQLRNFDPKKNLESDFEGLESLDPDEVRLQDYKDIQF